MPKIIIDTDIGGDVDDVLALALALNSPELEVLAVTTVNTDPAMRARIAAKQLRVFGRADIPVASGAKDQFDGSPTSCKDINQAVLLDLADPPAPTSIAEDLIIKTVQEHDDIILVGIGCYTNIAKAFKKAPDVMQRLNRLVLMGAKLESPAWESNINDDPSAAAYVFGLPVGKVLVTYDVSVKCRYQRHRHSDLEEAGHPRAKFLADAIEAWQNGRFAGNRTVEPWLYDPLTLGILIDPSLVEQTEEICVGMRLDPDAPHPVAVVQDGPPNVEVVHKVDRMKFEEMFSERIKR